MQRMPVRLALPLWALAAATACSDMPGADDALRAARAPEIARIAPAEEALVGAYVPTLDPMTMNGAEIDKILGPVARCEFRYTSASPPVLAISEAPARSSIAVVKLNGHLVMLEPETASVSEPLVLKLAAEPVRITVEPDPLQAADSKWRSEAAMVFEVDRQLHVGYRGYYGCTSPPPHDAPSP